MNKNDSVLNKVGSYDYNYEKEREREREREREIGIERECST